MPQITTAKHLCGVRSKINFFNVLNSYPFLGKVSDISPFINKKANVNHVSFNGSTALHAAMQNKDELKARALLAVPNIGSQMHFLIRKALF